MSLFRFQYISAKSLAEMDATRAAKLPEVVALAGGEVVSLRTYYSEYAIAPTGHHIGDVLTIWRLLATIDKLMSEPE